MNYIEYLNVPIKIAVVIIGAFFIMQIIGELIEFKGKVVPEFFKIRKYFARKKSEREVLSQMPELLKEVKKVPKTLKEVQTLLNNVNKHYSADNITKRNDWMDWVNHRADIYDAYGVCLEKLQKKMDENNTIILSILIDNKRNMIIDFASKVIDETYPVTREQFNRIFKVYEEYEDIIKKNKLTNGEVDIAIRIIRESYEKHMKNHTFVEDIRGYDV